MKARRGAYLEAGLAKLKAALGDHEGDPFDAAVKRLAKQQRAADARAKKGATK